MWEDLDVDYEDDEAFVFDDGFWVDNKNMAQIAQGNFLMKINSTFIPFYIGIQGFS